MKGTLQTNIEAIVGMQDGLEQRRTWVDKVADGIGGFSGSMTFVLLHVGWFLGWFLWNTGVVPGVKRFDPYPFILLAMIVSVEGVLLSTFVLMKQNRMQRKSDTRDHINLQIDLLAEKEVTKSRVLLRAIGRKVGIDEALLDEELEEMVRVTSVDSLAGSVEEKLVGDKS